MIEMSEREGEIKKMVKLARESMEIMPIIPNTNSFPSSTSSLPFACTYPIFFLFFFLQYIYIYIIYMELLHSLSPRLRHVFLYDYVYIFRSLIHLSFTDTYLFSNTIRLRICTKLHGRLCNL